ASRRVSIAALLRNWGIVYAGNFAGALGAAVLVYLSGTLALDSGAVGETAREIARAKLALPADHAFFRGVLCNALVCLAVWLCFSARDVAGKVLAIVWPISAFVALGFEHSVANMYLIPIGMLAGAEFDIGGFAHSLFWVTLATSSAARAGSRLFIGRFICAQARACRPLPIRPSAFRFRLLLPEIVDAEQIVGVSPGMDDSEPGAHGKRTEVADRVFI
ncbi:MAG TPA: formate/nitrite transporter family protein, partial [Stellaceae bacterium]|nr:formate/nitrite transporter family protein [Stellaceae bacterium]